MKGHDMEPIRPIIHAAEKHLLDTKADEQEQIEIVSRSQAEAAKLGKGYERTMNVLAIVKRRIIRRMQVTP
jgi:hypothetical protein